MTEPAEVDAAIGRVLGGVAVPEDLALMRAGLDAFAAAVSVREQLASVVDSSLELPDRSIGLRTYRDAGAVEDTLVWFHGGGYVSGSLDAIDPVCRSMARRTGLTVVSVDYRLAPEHPFPAALEDCLAVVRHLVSSAPRVAVGGDSAGGGLAAAVARELSGLAAVVLLCPWLDARLTLPSVTENGDGEFGLTESALRGFARMYGGDPLDPRVSPVLGDLAGLPPAVVVVAGLDPLRDEAEEYAAGVVAAGGVAHVRRWEGMVHGFAGMTAELPEADESLQWTADRLREVLALHAE